jgi:hypothetical protein
MKRSFILAVLVAGLYSRAFGQFELITNGGFEFGAAGWASRLGANATVVTNPVHSGAGALSITTVAGAEDIYQALTLPPNPIAATLSYYYNIYSVDGIHTPNAKMEVWLADAAGNSFLRLDVKDNSNWDQVAGTFHPMAFDLTPYMATNGGHLQLQFWVTTQSGPGGGTQFNLDDVSVQALDITARGLNDNFANATPLSGAFANVVATNSYSTKETGEPKHAKNAGGKSLWWRWTAPAWGVVTLTTANSSFDTLLAAYTGSDLSSLTNVAANDNESDVATASRISFPVTPGTEYKIAVDGKDGASGLILLSLTFAQDLQAPTVAFSSPSAGTLLTNGQVTVQGTAKDNVALARVEYRLENAAGTTDYQPATGTNLWTATVTNLIPGQNTVRVRAIDMSTNISTAVTRSFYYDVLLPAKGVYAGLFAETNNLTSTNAGFFSATVATKGKFSAKLLMAGHTYSLSGSFTTNGTYTRSFSGPGGTWLTAQLNLDLASQDAITGTVSAGAWSAPLRANKALYSRTSPAPQGGKKYTLAIQSSDADASQPTGYGFGAVTIDVAGNVKFSGTLGDATKVSQKTFLSKQGEWPLYLSATAGKEILQGWLVFTNTPDSDFNGTVSWMKQAQRAKLYPNGFAFTNGVGVVGSLYTFTKGVPALHLPTGGLVLLQQGNLPDDFITPFTLDSNNKVLGTNKLSLALSTATGTFKGSVPVPGSKKPIAVSGALFQKQNAGFGCFLGTNQTGRVTLQ